MRLARLYLGGFLLCAVLVLVAVAWVDRPVADYSHAHFWNTAVARWTWRVLGLLRPFVVLAALWIVGMAGWRLSGRPVPPWARTSLLAVSVSAGLAGSATILLKYSFGRSSVYPLYLVHRAYEWRPLRGDALHREFPSGTMAVAGAVLTVVCLLHPRLRVASAVVLLALAAGLIVTNGHWVGDIVAGLFLGIGVGPVALALCTRPFQATSKR